MKYRSEAFAAIYQTAAALYRVGAIEKETMQDFASASLAHGSARTPRASMRSGSPRGETKKTAAGNRGKVP